MMKKLISLLLCLVLCLGLAVPALGASGDGKATLSAALDPAELEYDGSADQTVTLTVSLSESVGLFSVHFEVDLPSGWTLTKLSGDLPLTQDYYSLDTGVVSWFDSKNANVKDLAVLTVTVPAKTPVKEYKIGVKNVELATAGENGGNNWMEGGEAYAALAILEKQEQTPNYVPPMNAALAFLKENVPNPGVGSTYGEWAVFALNRAGVAKAGWNDTYLENLKTYVDGKKGVLADKNYTEYSRVILALTSMGVDATKLETDKGTYDLVSPLLNKQSNGEYWAEWQGNNGTAFALLALDSHGYLDDAEGKAARAALIASLKSHQQANGAWPISNEGTEGLPAGFGDYDVTAAAIYALAPYYRDSSKLSALGGSVTHAQVKKMVDEALAFLSASQDADGGFGSVEADSWVVIALSSLNRDADADPDFVKNGNSLLADMLSYFMEDEGGFRHLMSGGVNQMATEEAAYGLVAYHRFKTGQKTLYDMSDVSFEQSDDKDEELVTVTFHLNGGKADGITDGKAKTYTKGDDGKALPKPTKDNYSFQGWFDQAEGGTKYTVVSADLPKDLYAQWKSSSSGGGGSSGGGSSDTITVTFRLIGAKEAKKDVDLGKEEYMPDYVTWIPTTTYKMDKGSSVYDLWVKATGDAGIRSEGAEQNYVKTVYAPASLGGYELSEFTNGKRSGWMYTINGSHPGFGLKEQELEDGDRVIWHYVNDYSYEVADWFEDDPRWPSLGDGRYYNRWLKAKDTFGGSGGGLGEGAGSGGSGGGGSSGDTELIPTYDGDTIWITAEVEHSEGGSAYAADAKLTKDVVAEGLEKAKDKSKLKVWVDIQDSNGVLLKIEAEAVKLIADANAGLQIGCRRGLIEIDGDAVAKMADAEGEARVTISYDDWNDKTRLSIAVNKRLLDVMMKVQLPSTDDFAAVFIVNEDSTLTVIRKSAVVDDMAYAVIPSGTTVQITSYRKFFYDVKESDWFAGAVYFVTTHELMQGVDKRAVFAPNDPMTRAMLVTVLYRLENEPEISGSLSFADVKEGSWYAEAVDWAAENGIVLGNGEGFAPNDNITREQIATILYRYAKYIGLDTTGAGDVSKFSDGDKVSSWAAEAMAWAVKVGLFKGDDTNSLNPQGNATRAEVATLLMRLVKLIVVS